MESDLLYTGFGKLVRIHRLRLKLTQDQLSERVGLSRTSITNIERGRQKVLLHQLFRLAESLHVSPDVLLPNIGNAQVPPNIERKLGRHLRDKEKDWVRRIVGSGAKGAEHNDESKD